MKEYAETRYSDYQRDYLSKDTKRKYVKLLPDNFDLDSITAKNSFVINAVTGGVLGAARDSAIQAFKIQESINCIGYNERNCIFQIVFNSSSSYINPHFVQLPEMLMLKRIRLGQISPFQRNTMVLVNRLVPHNALEPVQDGVCVIGSWNKKSMKQEEAERLNNLMIDVADYVECIMTSSIGMYL